MTSAVPVAQSRRAARALVAAACLTIAFAASAQKSPPPAKPATLEFGGTTYEHRWSKGGQNEFTPRGDADLSRWHDMVTIDVHAAVGNGEALAEVANRVLSAYQSHGKILRTDSKPRSAQRPAEHLIVAVLGSEGFLEAAFARFVLIDGVGVVAVYSHRVYGQKAGNAMSNWLKTNGPSIETTLMGWNGVPSMAALRRLPQSN